MALIVLLRGANLGKRRFSPVKLAKDLAHLELTNIGAAGTFVVSKRVAQAALRKEIAGELPWDDPDMVILKEDEVRDALEAGAKLAAPSGALRFGVALPKAPGKVELPVEATAKDGKWAMRIDALAGRVALGARRRWSETGAYSTKPLDAAIGFDRGTMRDWTTWKKIGAALDKEEDA